VGAIDPLFGRIGLIRRASAVFVQQSISGFDFSVQAIELLLTVMMPK
jgi:hypothetical protein